MYTFFLTNMAPYFFILNKRTISDTASVSGEVAANLPSEVFLFPLQH